jgi:hypothetical protein
VWEGPARNRKKTEGKNIMKQSMVFTVGTTTLVGAEGTPVKLYTDGTVIPCSATADEAIGVVEVGAAIGGLATIVSIGQPNCGLLVSATVKRGQFATVVSAGTSFQGGKTDAYVFMGVFLENGVAGDYVPAIVFPSIKHKA